MPENMKTGKFDWKSLLLSLLYQLVLLSQFYSVSLLSLLNQFYSVYLLSKFYSLSQFYSISSTYSVLLRVLNQSVLLTILVFFSCKKGGPINSPKYLKFGGFIRLLAEFFIVEFYRSLCCLVEGGRDV